MERESTPLPVQGDAEGFHLAVELAAFQAKQFQKRGATQINLLFLSGEAEEIERRLDAAAKRLCD